MGRERDLKIEENKPNSISVPWRFYRCIVFSSALLKNLDGLLKRLHQGKGQRVGWLPNFLPAFQQMKSAIFFIAQSSPINSLTSAEEGVAGGISQGGCPRLHALPRQFHGTNAWGPFGAPGTVSKDMERGVLAGIPLKTSLNYSITSNALLGSTQCK